MVKAASSGNPKSESVRRTALNALARGATLAEAAELIGVNVSTVWRWSQRHGVAMCAPRKPRPGALTQSEREEIRAGIQAEDSDAVIAERLGRHRGTVGREIKANGGRVAYRAHLAQARAETAARRPKLSWTEARPELWVRGPDVCCEKSGRRSRSPLGCAETTPTSQIGGCHTRRSTRPSSSRPKASCARSWLAAFAPDGLGAGLEGAQVTRDGSQAWSTSPNDRPKSLTGPCPATGKEIWSSVPGGPVPSPLSSNAKHGWEC